MTGNVAPGGVGEASALDAVVVPGFPPARPGSGAAGDCVPVPTVPVFTVAGPEMSTSVVAASNGRSRVELVVVVVVVVDSGMLAAGISVVDGSTVAG